MALPGITNTYGNNSTNYLNVQPDYVVYVLFDQQAFLPPTLFLDCYGNDVMPGQAGVPFQHLLLNAPAQTSLFTAIRAD
ncbi:hypothetical protein [Synechococcus lacustris]|uniref:hypothetical protein n=1 Tax=Synechococcus lacustris TaxID=2116544 RepID=UPI003340480B